MPKPSHSGGQTLCLLEPDFDFCWHGFIPDSCPEGCGDGPDDEYDWPEDG
jgi:hypothetical protein